METNKVYFVECPNCAKHSTEVNDYWNDNNELFICDCGHPMYDGWEDEEVESDGELAEEPAKIKAKLSHGVDYGFTGKQVTGLIVIGQSVEGIEVDPAYFFHAEKVDKIKNGQKGFLFSYDIGYRECLTRYPEIV